MVLGTRQVLCFPLCGHVGTRLGTIGHVWLAFGHEFWTWVACRHGWARFGMRQNDGQQPSNILDIFGHVWTRALVCLIVVLRCV